MLSFIKKYSVPNFLKRLDYWLLTNKPHIWHTKIHYLLFYTIIGSLSLFTIGFLIPQDLYMWQNGYLSAEVVIDAAAFLGFLLFLGGLIGWWYAIQKTQYRHSFIGHFTQHILIYAVGLWSIFVLAGSFHFGFTYKTCYFLDKMTETEKEWLKEKKPYDFVYFPHYMPNKLENIDAYFANSEKICDAIDKKEQHIEQLIEQHKLFSDDKSSGSDIRLKESDVFVKQDFSAESKRIKTKEDITDYIGNGKPKLKERIIEVRKQLNFEEHKELIEKISVHYFYDVYTAPSSINKILLDYIEANNFLLSLDNNEKEKYTTFLNEITKEISLYEKENIIVAGDNINKGIRKAFAVYLDKLRRKKELKELESITVNCSQRNHDYGVYLNANIETRLFITNESKIEKYYALLNEKFEKLMLSFDINSKIALLDFVIDYSYYNRNSDNWSVGSEDVNEFDKLMQLKSNKALDSLIYPEYYFLNSRTAFTLNYKFASLYADYYTKKFSDEEIERIYVLLEKTGFKNLPPQYKNDFVAKAQILILLEQYNRAVNKIKNIKDDRDYLLIFYTAHTTILFFIVLGIIFYMVTINKGINLWIGIFISSILWPLIFSCYFTLNGYERITDKTGSLVIFIIPLLLFLYLILRLLINKKQVNRINIWVLTSLIFGLGGIFALMNYFIEVIYRQDNGFIKEYKLSMTLNSASLALLIWLPLYFLLVWQYKKHLHLPKKK